MTGPSDRKRDAKPALTPKLRFPEFRGAPGWEETTLESVALLKNGYAFRSADYVESGSFQILTIANVQQGRLDLNSTKRIAEFPSDIQTHQILHPGDILISMTGNVGRICIVSCEGLLLNQRVGKLVPQRIDQRFFYQLLQRDDFRNTMQLRAAGGAQGNLSSGDILEYSFSRPITPVEQQKIAECLGSLDELIAAENQKLAALKAHKNGLMQQLFPRAGETTPRLRFPEFQDASEWVIKQLGELAYYENGKAYEQDIVENGKYVVVNSRFISTDGAIRKYTNANYIIAKTGEVLMVLSDLPKGKALAKCYFVDADERYAVNQRVCRLKPKQIDGKLLYYVLNRHPHLLAFDDGLNQTHLSKGGVIECPLCVPQDNAEQRRIADCLTSLDTLITAETQKLEALKTHKQGLMQQLFPSPTNNES